MVLRRFEARSQPRSVQLVSVGILAFALFTGGCAAVAGPSQSQIELDAGEVPTPGFDGGTLGSLLPATTQSATTPPISGGTLLVSRDGMFIVASDPENDQIDIASSSSIGRPTTVTLLPGDEPGRAVEDAAGRVHVVLRGGGAVVTVDLTSGALIARTPMCPLPRGIDYEPPTDSVVVVCAGGEVVTLPAAGGGGVTQTLHLDPDLRDVIYSAGYLYVSRFREAELLTIDSTGTVVSRTTPALLLAPTNAGVASPGQPTVAWRTLHDSQNNVVMLHQYTRVSSVPQVRGGYASPQPCSGGLVQSAVSMLPSGSSTAPGVTLNDVVLGVDAAISPDGTRIAFASAGNLPITGEPQVVEFPYPAAPGDGGCATGSAYSLPGQVVAVAYAPWGGLIAQTRDPAGIWTPPDGTWSVFLSAPSRRDTGHTIFHANAGGGITCASCHPEGRDDGHVWSFNPTGPRRTQSLRGSLLSRMPFHWDGDLAGMSQLAEVIFDQRMNGGALADDQVAALGHWLDALPPLPAPTPTDSQQETVARGRQLFNDPTVGCSGCHTGPLFTNNSLVNVGTGGVFKTPSLIAVAWRPPYLHNGCAASLMDRFTNPCGGRDHHGHTTQLPLSDLAALVAYLSSL